MKINGVEVQGIRRVHIEDVVGKAEKVWMRIGRCSGGYFWDDMVSRGSEVKYFDRCVDDETILGLIRFAFRHRHRLKTRVKLDTVYIKVRRQDGLVWLWEVQV